MHYPFREIEPKWQKYWEENKTFSVNLDRSRPKYYILDMYPYPSGAGLHVGHPEGYTATDIIARYKRMRGFNVLHPMGWDAFGLPAEQYAVKTGVHPAITTKQNIDTFRRQIKSIGLAYDWEREVNTTDPAYYKWTQWIFTILYNRGLAYIAEVPVNWCPELGTVLANEEVPEQVEKGFTVVRRPMRQWMLKITAYAERLLNDLELLDWPESLKEMQRNWIGKSEGAEIDFPVDDRPETIRVFTTRPDTLWGATYMVLAPEHRLVDLLATGAQAEAVAAYRETAKRKSDLERTELAKEKTGVFTGGYALNPATGGKIPIWIADYVLITYGTGAIMAVPGHDQRDWEFARKFGLPIVEVVSGGDVSKEAWTGDGVAVNSGFIDGLPVAEAKARTIAWLVEQERGKATVNYKLRDWLFSRQRYWGEPFPVIHLEDGTHKVLPGDHLPVTLPAVESYKPSGTGESPLATMRDWVHTVDPETGKPALRETNTMPQWAGSCWYYLRYLDARNDREFCSKENENYWMPIDLYVGGAEHAVLHLLYARFWHKVLFDEGYVSTPEPFMRLVNQGMILGEDGRKMSKSFGNVINPDDVIHDYGADTLRLFEMFMGPLEAVKPWNTKGVEGVSRFLNRVWRLFVTEEGAIDPAIIDGEAPEEILRLLHKSIRKVGEDIEGLRFNTAISALMILVNEIYKQEWKPKDQMTCLLQLLNPFAPHLTEELWQMLGRTTILADEPWPAFDEGLTRDDTVEVVLMVNGKPRDKALVAAGTQPAELEAIAKESARVRAHTEGKTIVKVIAVVDKMVNVVVK